MKLNNATVLEAGKQDGGVRYLVEHRSTGQRFEILSTQRSYGGTQGLWEINPLRYGEPDTSNGEGFVKENKIESTLDALAH